MPPPVSPTGPPASRPLVPPVRVWITLSSLAAAVLLVRAGLLETVAGEIVDRAVRNIITLILCFFGLVSLVVWFLRESGHARATKRVVGYGLVVAIAAGVALFRIERVSGDLVPELRLRWMPARDRMLPPAQVAAAATVAGSWEPTERDFARFLGPTGSASLSGPGLDPDWESHPPREAWRTVIGAGWSGFAICGDHAVTLEQRGEEELITCRSVENGSLEWAVPVRGRHETVLGGVGPRSTPTIRDGVVYATGATGWLHAIDGSSGSVLWKKNVVSDLGLDPVAHAEAVTWGRAGSPLVTAELVIVPGGGPFLRPEGRSAGSLVAYARADGSRRWTAGGDQISYVTPQIVTIGGRELVLTVNESRVAAYDLVAGEELWGFDWPGHSNSDATCSQPHVLPGDRIFISKGYGIGAGLFAAEEGGGEPVFRSVWRQSGLLKTKFTNVTIYEGHAYGLSDGILECVRLEDGRRQWKGGRYGQGQVLRVGEWLLVQAEAGDVVLVDCVPDKHRERARFAALDGQTWNNLALSGDRLLVRNAEEAACFILPLREPGEATP